MSSYRSVNQYTGFLAILAVPGPCRFSFRKIRTQILPNEDFEISCHIRLNKEFTETIEIDGKSQLSAIDIDIKVSGTLYIARR